jgi:glycosyltransferase involved in cell wall biosynthesis
MELMIHNLAVHLTQAGDLVTLYAPKPNKPFQEIPHNYWLKRFRNEEHLQEMFRRQHAVLPVDVILVQGGLEAASMALKLKDELGVPVVLRTHGEDIQTDEATGYGYRRDATKRATIDSNIRRVDRNVVIGEHIAPLVKQIAPETTVQTIHNGVDVNRFRPQVTRYLREKLALDDDKLILLTVGRNVKKKALHLAVQALQRVLERVPQAVLVHAGKDGNGENLQQQADTLGVAHAFYELGEVNYFETPLLYASADLFVFPSKVETFGNVTVEALSSGLPCVEFDYEVNRQKIASGRNGYIVPFGDVEGLADRLVELLLDVDKRREFSNEARKAAVETFAWSRVAENYRRVFQEFRSVDAIRRQPSLGYGTPPISSRSEHQ